jgi:ABC-type sugar transport system ATPase subunit
LATLELANIVKTFDRTKVLHGIDLAVSHGEFVVFVGPSGCGKSTLLRVIAGLETPSAGDIRIDGQVVNNIGAAQRGCAMVFQSYALYPHMSVYDNMAFGLENLAVPRPQIQAKVQDAARLLRLEDLLQRKPTQLSGGQRQRVAIGRAIVRDPRLFLFDEPLSNLDAELRVSMRAELRELHARLGATMVYVTHDQVEAMTLSDQLVVMNGGQIEQVGVPTEIYRRPQTTFVAGFIGSPPMNMLKARLERGGVRIGGMVLPVLGLKPGQAEGSEVTVGLRPEDIVAFAASDQGHRMAVDFVEELGATRLLHGSFESQTVVVQVAGSQGFADGSQIGFSVPAEAVHVFDTGTGVRLN